MIEPIHQISCHTCGKIHAIDDSQMHTPFQCHTCGKVNQPCTRCSRFLPLYDVEGGEMVCNDCLDAPRAP